MTANPKLSQDGRAILHGFGDLWCNGAPLLFGGQPLRGQHPGWLDINRIGYLDPDGWLLEYRGPDVAPTRLFDVPFNAVAMGGGKWIGMNSDRQTTYASDGSIITDTYAPPAMSPDGSRWACLRGAQTEQHELVVNNAVLARGPFDDREGLSVGPTVVAISQFVDGLPQTFACIGVPPNQILRPVKATYQRYEVGPVQVTLPDGEVWLVSHDNDRTLVRPVGSTWGYPLAGAKTPHGMWNASTNRLRVVGDLETRLLDVSLDLSAPRVDLSQPPPVDPPAEIVPLPVGTVIADTLPYVLGRADRWPRTGSHAMDQIRVEE